MNSNFENPPFIGDWQLERKLGSGGFGEVTLWRNRKNHKCCAIKKCHLQPSSGGPNPANQQQQQQQQKQPLQPTDPNLKIQKERWNREVEYMTNEIKNENIVCGIRIEPANFLIELNKYNPSGMPVLIMEYCEGGDLRRALNINPNICGFGESEIRNILKCLSNAISYLHNLKITHRDIKPENIVIKLIDGKKIYKLTDLGYAKPLDRQSIVASLVGTLEYIAPELCFNDKYSSSVDYWSFGIIAYEIIIGSRPFVPHLPLAQWVLSVKKKKSTDIAIIENTDGELNYLTELPPEYQISECFAKLIESWLKLALEWNPKQRGNIFETIGDSSGGAIPKSDQLPPISVLKIFTMLDSILKKRILRIFCLHTYQELSYEINESTKMTQLYEWINKDTRIPIDKIRLILPILHPTLTHVNLQTTRPIQLFYSSENSGGDGGSGGGNTESPSNQHDRPMVYCTHIGEPMIANRIVIPHLIKIILADKTVKLKPHLIKCFAYNVSHLLRSEQRNYLNSLEGMNNYVLHLNHDIEVFDSVITKMLKKVYGIDGGCKLLNESIRAFEKKLKHESNEHLDQQTIPTLWLDDFKKLQTNIKTIVGACESLLKRYKSVYRNSRDILKHPILQKIDQDYFNIIEMDKKFDIIRQQLLKRIIVDGQHMDMFKCAYACLKQRDKLLCGTEFSKWHLTTASVALQIEEIEKSVGKAINQLDKYDQDLIKLNIDHQERIWRMAKISITPEYLPDIDRMMNYVSIDLVKERKRQQGQVTKTNPNNLSTSSQSQKPPARPPKYLSTNIATTIGGLNKEDSASASSASATTTSTTANQNGIDFKIGEIVTKDIKTNYGNSILCFGEGNDTNSLIGDNEHLRLTLNGLIQELDADFK